ncbi:hypothetical protein BH23CHL5_BH23CHL5_28480 [soil metagenome]
MANENRITDVDSRQRTHDQERRRALSGNRGRIRITTFEKRGGPSSPTMEGMNSLCSAITQF